MARRRVPAALGIGRVTAPDWHEYLERVFRWRPDEEQPNDEHESGAVELPPTLVSALLAAELRPNPAGVIA